jgi:hypothetical protein
MILTGREMQALLGAMLLHGDVPFVESEKESLSSDEEAAAEAARTKLLAAKRRLQPSEPRNPGSWQIMLDDAGEVAFDRNEARTLAKISAACLTEVKTDGGLSPFAGPGIGLAALRSAHAKVAALVAPAPS